MMGNLQMLTTGSFEVVGGCSGVFFGGKLMQSRKGGLKSLGGETAVFPERPDPRASPWLMGWQGEGVS